MANNILSDESINTLTELVRWWRSRPVQQVRSYNRDETDYPCTDCYVALSPRTGIPGRSEHYPQSWTGTGTGTGTGDAGPRDRPGRANCEIYQIVLDTTGTYYQLESAGFTLTVNNLSACTIPGQQWFTIVRDKYGEWIAQYRDCGTAPVVIANPPTLIQSADSGTRLDGVTSRTFPSPSSYQSGDLLIAIFDGNSGYSLFDNVQAPAGWTQLAFFNNVNVSCYVSYKILTGSEPADYTFTFREGVSPTNWGCSIYTIQYRGAGTPTCNTNTGSSTTPTAPTITATQNGSILVAYAGYGGDLVTTPTAPTGMSVLYGPTPTSYYQVWNEEVDSGATGTRSTTISPSNEWGAASILIPPP